MIPLHSKGNEIASNIHHEKPFIGRVTTNITLPYCLRSKYILLMATATEIPEGFGLVLIAHDEPCNAPINTIYLASELRYLQEHDVIKFYPDSLKIDALYRRNANHNSFLVTERCNSFCIMCSQPPRKIDDHYLVDDFLAVLPLIHQDTHEIGITGGEATLWGDDFIRMIQAAKNHLPNTALHILSNGRNFKDLDLAIKIASVKHQDVMIGIPLYADYSQLHDFIVQADNAFDDTIRGILNLKRCKVPVEIRVVMHKANYHRLPKLAEFIARNLLFVDHVALMGMEFMGFAKSNLEALWIDPYNYRNELQQAVETMARAGMNVSVYNTPYCLVPESIRSYSIQSISDWKNDYLGECNKCTSKSKCGGFFSSNLTKVSDHIKAME